MALEQEAGLRVRLAPLRPRGAHPEQPVELAQLPGERPQQPACRVRPPELLLHRHVVLLQVRQPHPHPGHLQLQLPVLPPHRRIVVPWRDGPTPACPAPRAVRELAGPTANAG